MGGKIQGTLLRSVYGLGPTPGQGHENEKQMVDEIVICEKAVCSLRAKLAAVPPRETR